MGSTKTDPARPVRIIGGGISGLSAALLLARAGREVCLWEGTKQIGGLLAPISFADVACDRGSHRVHPESHPLLRELTVSEDWQSRPRRGRLILNGQHLHYPPNPLGFIRGLGVRASAQMLGGFATRPGALQAFKSWETDRSLAPDEDVGFEDFILRRVGRGAYERFYKPYVTKVWGLPPAEISQTVAKQRISTSKPMETFRRAVSREKVDRRFLYPRGGMAGLVQSLRRSVEEAGVQIVEDRAFDSAVDLSPDHDLVFTGRLRDLVVGADLQHRGLYLIFLAIPKGLLDEVDTWYAPESRYWFGRVSQPAQFSSEHAHADHDVLCIEIPEGQWGPEKDFLSLLPAILSQLHDAGILPEHTQPLDQAQRHIEDVYPLYRRGWFHEWRRALDEVRAMGEIWPLGRQGLFLHCNMDHCVNMADQMVQEMEQGQGAADWINQAARYLDLRVRD
jgi:UDP-galactopyranose mutase